MDNLVELYCLVDDFCKEIIPELQLNMLPKAQKRRGPTCRLSQSEIMTIMILFHQSGYRNFKTYYTQYILKHLHKDFSQSVSYARFIELMSSVLLLLCLFVHFQSKTATGIYFINSTILAVCHHKRTRSNRVFKGMAKKSKSTMGWFFGFKLHLLINDKGELLAFKLTPGNVDDRKPVDLSYSRPSRKIDR